MSHHHRTSTTAQTPKWKNQNNINFWSILQSPSTPCWTPEWTTSAPQTPNAKVKFQVTPMSLFGSLEYTQTKQTHTLKTDQLSSQSMIWLMDIQAKLILLDTESSKNTKVSSKISPNMTKQSSTGQQNADPKLNMKNGRQCASMSSTSRIQWIMEAPSMLTLLQKRHLSMCRSLLHNHGNNRCTNWRICWQRSYPCQIHPIQNQIMEWQCHQTFKSMTPFPQM